MSAPFLIRPATADDAGQLAVLCGELGYPSTESDVRARWTFAGDAEHAILLAVDESGSATGFVDVHARRLLVADAHAEVGGLVVADGRRGTGVGAALLAAAADWARARRLPRLWIRANLAREGAHDFYAAVGCRVVKDQRVYEYPL